MHRAGADQGLRQVRRSASTRPACVVGRVEDNAHWLGWIEQAERKYLVCWVNLIKQNGLIIIHS